MEKRAAADPDHRQKDKSTRSLSQRDQHQPFSKMTTGSSSPPQVDGGLLKDLWILILRCLPFPLQLRMRCLNRFFASISIEMLGLRRHLSSATRCVESITIGAGPYILHPPIVLRNGRVNVYSMLEGSASKKQLRVAHLGPVHRNYNGHRAFVRYDMPTADETPLPHKKMTSVCTLIERDSRSLERCTCRRGNFGSTGKENLSQFLGKENYQMVLIGRDATILVICLVTGGAIGYISIAKGIRSVTHDFRRQRLLLLDEVFPELSSFSVDDNDPSQTVVKELFNRNDAKGSRLVSMRLTRDGHHLVVMDSGQFELLIFSSENLTQPARILFIGKPILPQAAQVDIDAERRIYVRDVFAKSILVFDWNDGKVLQTIPAEGGSSEFCLRLDGTLFILEKDSRLQYVVTCRY